MRLSRTLEIALSLAIRDAHRRRHEFLTLEHLLFALCHDDAVVEVLRACGGDVDKLKRTLDTYLEQQVERLPNGV